MDTLKAIQVFVCIAQQGNLSKAAEHITLYQVCLKAEGIAMLPTLLVRQDIAQQRLQQVFTDFLHLT